MMVFSIIMSKIDTFDTFYITMIAYMAYFIIVPFALMNHIGRKNQSAKYRGRYASGYKSRSNNTSVNTNSMDYLNVDYNYSNCINDFNDDSISPDSSGYDAVNLMNHIGRNNQSAKYIGIYASGYKSRSNNTSVNTNSMDYLNVDYNYSNCINDFNDDSISPDSSGYDAVKDMYDFPDSDSSYSPYENQLYDNFRGGWND